MKRLSLRLTTLSAALLLAGCASVSPDGLRSDVAEPKSLREGKR